MVLLAMLVPMALLLRGYALEDRLSRAALEVQATETVVSGAGRRRGERLPRPDQPRHDGSTTVLYPGAAPRRRGDRPEPGRGRPRASRPARPARRASTTSTAAPRSWCRSRSAAAPPRRRNTPVIRVVVHEPGLAESDILRSWLVLLVLGVVLLAGALVLADRLGRSFVQPIRRARDVRPARSATGADPSPSSRPGRPRCATSPRR